MPEDMCQYAGSRLWFRGPVRALDDAYVACVGGDETFGRFVDRPFPSVLETRLGRSCANFGSLFCGIEAMSRDPGLLELINGSRVCVVQAPDLICQSNRFYRVHPRRNDRFLEPTKDLIDLYPELDFTEFHFVRHLLGRLSSQQDARFEVVAQELRVAWARNLLSLIKRIIPPVILLRLQIQRQPDMETDPIPVDAQMIDALRPACAGVLDLPVRVSGDSDELEDMIFGTLQQPMAEHMIGPATHRMIADALLPMILDLN